jgi:hypothetical protein
MVASRCVASPLMPAGDSRREALGSADRPRAGRYFNALGNLQSALVLRYRR